MSSQYDLPPNPREAKYRRAPVHWAAYPVTVVLIVFSIVVAALSKIGDDKSKITALFFAEPLTESRLESLWEETYQDHLIHHSVPDALATDAQAKLQKEFESRIRRGNFGEIFGGQVWRLFTPMFIHFGILHILFNMMWLWDFGRVLESRFRSLRFALLVLATSIAANVTQAFFSGANFGGMSGVNYGLFGFIFLRQQFHPAGDIRLNPQTVPYMLIWLVVCFTGAVGPVANGAHVAGLICGAVIGWINAMMGGGWALMKRRREFQRSITRSDSVLHRCAVCQKSEQDDPNMDFRIGHDGEEYCAEHLPPKA